MMGEQDVRERLQAVEVPATSLRVETVVAGGRKQARRSRMLQAGCGAALATGLLAGVPAVLMHPGDQPPAQAAAAPAASPGGSAGPRQATPNPDLPTLRCAATSLPIPSGMTSVQPADVDPTGRYVLGNNSRSSDKLTPEGKVAGVASAQVVLWTNGRPQALPKVRDWTAGDAVNAGGTVAAIAGAKDKPGDAVVRYTAGVPEQLTPPAGAWTFSLASINAGGDILVNASRQGGDDRTDAVLLWKAGSATAVKIPLPRYARGTSLLDDGTIVGDLATGNNGTITSYTWNQQGKGQALKAPAGQDGSVSNAHGDWATGNLWPSGEVARWNLRTGEVTQLPVGSPAQSINAKGWIASDGTVLRNDTNVDLGLLPDGTRGDPLYLSDSGLVVGLPFTGASGVITWQCNG
ncbi:hypothetical protein [Actinoplanes sp. N902-109]|uniref:hypothetical protein n=1 Tax=Actinoplanes sp. (strain N902-109) TaxID=649831 RepID=UPI0003A77DD9|nr:hypothetical protein [Actinoplanes sp. N902-109]